MSNKQHDRIALSAVQAGLTPGKMERAYAGDGLAALSTDYGIALDTLRALAVRWGIVE